MNDLKWIRAKGCESNGCVEVAFGAKTVLVRSTEAPDHMLGLTRAEWDQLRTGEFEEQR